jgi:hypothetical protein
MASPRRQENPRTTWFSQAHDLIAFALSRGSAILLAESRYRLVATANGPGYDD